jgi:hypothetical protein
MSIVGGEEGKQERPYRLYWRASTDYTVDRSICLPSTPRPFARNSAAAEMTEQEWLLLHSSGELSGELSLVVQPRKLFLLGVFFLRRVWSLLNEKERQAVNVTEQFARCQVSARVLVETWYDAETATGEGVWLDDRSNEILAIGCPCCLEALERHGSQGIQLGVRSAARDPAWFAARTALHARQLVGDAAPSHLREAAILAETSLQYDLYRDIVGDPSEKPGTRSVWVGYPPVRDLLLSFEGSDTIESLALLALADALEDAGCQEREWLAHCRSIRGHVRGCWVIEALRGRTSLSLPVVEDVPTREFCRAW